MLINRKIEDKPPDIAVTEERLDRQLLLKKNAWECKSACK